MGKIIEMLKALINEKYSELKELISSNKDEIDELREKINKDREKIRNLCDIIGDIHKGEFLSKKIVKEQKCI